MQSTSVEANKPSFLQKVKDGVSYLSRTVGGFLGRITAPIRYAVQWTIGKALTGVYYLTQVPVVGKFVSFLPISAIGMGIATVALGVIEAFSVGVVPAMGMFLASLGPLGWALMLGTVELAILLTLLDTSIRIMAWCLIPAYRKAVDLEV